MAKKKPGVMLYFRWRSSLRLLNHQQLGQLFAAILDYGETGQQLQSDDPFLLFAWNAILPDMDHDTLRYEQIVEKRRQAAGKRWEQAAPASTPPPAREEKVRDFPRTAPRTAVGQGRMAAYNDPGIIERYL